MNTNQKITNQGERYNRRNFLKKTASTAIAAPWIMRFPNIYAKSNGKRNIIFILSDDHRYDAMSCLNHPIAQTPNMDRLLKDGIHFKNAFVTTSLCSPSRASILTGLYVHKHGVLDNRTLIPKGTLTFPVELSRAGYRTGFVGKWHMGGSNDNPRPGFDRWVSLRGQGQWFNPLFNIDGIRQKPKGYVSDLVTEFSLEFVKKNKDRPFFLYMSHKAVHENFTPAPRHKDEFKNVTMPRPITFPDTDENYQDKPEWVRRQRKSCHGIDGLSYTHNIDVDGFNRRYAQCLLGLDESIGALTDLLDKEGLLEDTFIVYMGDNGFQFGEHGLIDKRVMYEESIRVPFFVHCPSLTGGGSVVEEMVLNIDIAPTLIDAAGVNVPSSIHGHSFLPLIKGSGVDWRKDFLYEYFWERAYPMTPTIRGLRTEKYSYIKSYGTWDKYELYDIENDPYQTKNLLGDVYPPKSGRTPEGSISDPELKKLVSGFEERIIQIIEETDGNLKPQW